MLGQLEEYTKLLESELPNPAIVYLGDGYFVSMERENAKKFLERKISILKRQKAELDQLNGVNEEGLPIFDIIEELDEEGNVIKSELKRTGIHQLDASDESDASARELLESTSDAPEIDEQDMLELELVDEPVDFDFEHMEVESESESDDEDMDWQGGGLFPQNEATLRAIKAHLESQASKQSEQSSEPSEPSEPNDEPIKEKVKPPTSDIVERNPDLETNKEVVESAPKGVSEKAPEQALEQTLETPEQTPEPSRKVHFSNKVSVREFEKNTSMQPLSRFKQQRSGAQGAQGAPSGAQGARTNPPSAPSAAAAAAMAASKRSADAQKIFENSFIPDVEFLKLHDHSEPLKPQLEEEKPILSQVLEKETNSSDDLVNFGEIKQEYQRLKQQMVYNNGGYIKKDSEKAVEPIGGKKVSRFKAARI